MLKASGADKFAGQFRNAASNIQGMTGHTEKASMSVRKFIGVAAGVLATVGVFRTLRDSVSGAVARFDTLKTFPRVMELLGNSTESSEAAIQKLSDGIDGLPTTLDGVASTTQRIAAMTGDLDGAVDITLALNNAFLASGASTADASRGLDQYVQMLAKGEVDLQSWRTLQETMPVALNKTAEAFGYTGESAQNDLYDALKEGEITFNDFNAQIIELSNETGGFADLAKEASKGIATSWQNIKTAVVKGMADMIGTIDDALESFGGISGVLDMVKESTRSMFIGINEVLPKVIDSINSFIERAKEVYNSLQPWLPLFASIAIGLLTVTKSVQAFVATKALIQSLRVAVIALNASIWANPWTWVAAAAIAAIVLIIYYWEPISKFFIDLWDKIKIGGLAVWVAIKATWAATVSYFKDLWSTITAFFSGLWSDTTSSATSVWDSVMAVWQSTVDWFKSIWNTISTFFSALWAGIVAVATSVWDTVTAKWQQVVTFVTTLFAPLIEFFTTMWNTISENAVQIWNNITSTLSAVWSNIQTMASAAWQLIKNVILGPILLLIDLITGDMDSFRANLSQIWNNIKSAASTIWTALKDSVSTIIKGLINQTRIIWETFRSFITGLWTALKDTASNIFELIKSTVTTKMQQAKSLLTQIWQAIKTMFNSAMDAIRNWTKQKFEQIKNSIKQGMDQAKSNVQSAWNAIKNFFSTTLVNILNDLKSKFTSMVSSVRDKMNELKQRIVDGWNSAKSFLTSIDLVSIGKNIIQGLINGIGSMVGKVKDKISDVANTVKNGIKGALGIHSPSRWMRDMIGKNMMAGWEIGIQKEKRSVQKMAAKATEWMKPEMPDMQNMIMKAKSLAAPAGGLFNVGATVSGINGKMRSQINSAVSTDVNLGNNRMEGLLQRIADKEQVVVLDSGQLVGSTRGKFDQANGTHAQLAGRWGR